MIKGRFDETLPGFLQEHPENIAYIHIDCDTYQATKYVLHECRTRLTADSIIVIDDYHGFRGFKEGQFKAWAEFVADQKIEYDYLAFNRRSVIIKIKSNSVRPSEPLIPSGE